MRFIIDSASAPRLVWAGAFLPDAIPAGIKGLQEDSIDSREDLASQGTPSFNGFLFFFVLFLLQCSYDY